jgi:Uma2 family endonuclease
MSEPSKVPYMTVEEYLKHEDFAMVRHEYVRGQIFAMTDATEAHNVICGNLFTRVHAHVRGSGCRAFMNDMKVRVEVSDSFYYPDMMVTCEPFEAKSVYKASPVLIIEALSPSTRQIDRREKLVAYQQLSSLQEYVIVHQSKPLVELYRKQEDGKWTVSMLRTFDKLYLQSLPNKPFSVPVREIYEDLDFSSFVEESTEDYEPA